jgi:hypothetical protein
MRVSTMMACVLLIAMGVRPAAGQRWNLYQPPAPSPRVDLPTRPMDSGAGATIPPPAIGRQLDGIDDGIRAGRASGQLSRKEARALRRENRAIAGLASRYAENGLSPSEARELQIRTEVMRDMVNNRRLRPRP